MRLPQVSVKKEIDAIASKLYKDELSYIDRTLNVLIDYEISDELTESIKGIKAFSLTLLDILEYKSLYAKELYDGALAKEASLVYQAYFDIALNLEKNTDGVSDLFKRRYAYLRPYVNEGLWQPFQRIIDYRDFFNELHKLNNQHFLCETGRAIDNVSGFDHLIQKVLGPLGFDKFDGFHEVRDFGCNIDNSKCRVSGKSWLRKHESISVYLSRPIPKFCGLNLPQKYVSETDVFERCQGKVKNLKVFLFEKSVGFARIGDDGALKWVVRPTDIMDVEFTFSDDKLDGTVKVKNETTINISAKSDKQGRILEKTWFETKESCCKEDVEPKNLFGDSFLLSLARTSSNVTLHEIGFTPADDFKNSIVDFVLPPDSACDLGIEPPSPKTSSWNTTKSNSSFEFQSGSDFKSLSEINAVNPPIKSVVHMLKVFKSVTVPVSVSNAMTSHPISRTSSDTHSTQSPPSSNESNALTSDVVIQNLTTMIDLHLQDLSPSDRTAPFSTADVPTGPTGFKSYATDDIVPH
ncbi:hypothetical protein HDU76_002492, partial [Blyttiomyces sp. JEL0837]